MPSCSRCDMEMAVADTRMVRYWIALIVANPWPWKGRLRNRTAWVCPKCDAYALGAELLNGPAFYSQSTGAYLTVNDRDWWNRDPKECDIRAWPDFGCLTFSEVALRSTVGYLRECDPKILANTVPRIFEPDLIGPTGIPEGENSEREWANQLRILHERMRGEFSEGEIDAAVRMLVRVLVDGNCKRD